MYYAANFNVTEQLKLTRAATVYHFTTVSLDSYAQLSASHKTPPKKIQTKFPDVTNKMWKSTK